MHQGEGKGEREGQFTCARRGSISRLSNKSSRRLIDGVGHSVGRVRKGHMHARPPATLGPALPHDTPIHHAIPPAGRHEKVITKDS